MIKPKSADDFGRPKKAHNKINNIRFRPWKRRPRMVQWSQLPLR